MKGSEGSHNSTKIRAILFPGIGLVKKVAQVFLEDVTENWNDLFGQPIISCFEMTVQQLKIIDIHDEIRTAVSYKEWIDREVSRGIFSGRWKVLDLVSVVFTKCTLIKIHQAIPLKWLHLITLHMYFKLKSVGKLNDQKHLFHECSHTSYRYILPMSCKYFSE